MNNLLKTADAMAEALRTFAIVADAYDPPEDDDDTEAWDHRFCIGDLRRAHEALSAYEAAKKEAEETIDGLRALRPGDELPGGLVVVLKNLLRVALGLDRKKPLDITTSALVEAGARHDLIAILAAAKEGTK